VKIPTDLTERENFYQEVIKKCTSSQQDRGNQYADLRNYYLFGGAEGIGGSPFNKIYPHIDLLTSFLYASETTKFSVHLGATAKEAEFGRVPKLAQAVNDMWLDSNADRVVSEAITWALVDNTRIVKLLPKVNRTTKKLDGIYPYSVHPANFGVYREDVAMLDRQEAMCESYYTTKTQLEIDLANHPQKEAILKSVATSSSRELEDDNQGGIGRLMASTQQPLVDGTTAVGNVDFYFNSNINYVPDLDQHELITMDELWVWDTDKSDYRMVTRIRNGMTVYDRIASEHHIFLAGEHPYIQFCPRPLPFYFWGMSEVAGLANLQEWYNERIMQIRKLLNLQVKPPTDASGFGSTADEKMYALFSEGGLFSDGGMGVQTGKLQRHPPELPNDLFTVLREIDQAFSDHSGLPNTVQGKGEIGVRSGKQTSELARLGSARIKKRALIIEDSLEKMATLYLKLKKKYDPDVYLDESGASFTASQFTDDFTVKVDAHSNSPIFVEDKKELAFSMLENKMITRERAVEMIDPVDKEIIKRELKSIEAQEAAQAKAEQEAVAKGKAAKGTGKAGE
jgi:hypothetical protein